MKQHSAAIDVSQDEGPKPPFASYAQTVRMLMPLARKVAFYDERGRVLWVSDGIEEAELNMQVQLLIARFVNDDPRERDLNAHSELPRPVHVFPVRDSRNTVIGALAVQFDELPQQAAYRSYATVQRMLAPILEILQHGWRVDGQSKPMHWQQNPDTETPVVVAATAASVPRADSTPKVQRAVQQAATQQPVRATPTALPAVLRRLLVEASEATDAAFGTIVLPGHAFSFNHRRGEDESDLNVSAAADAARLKMLQWMVTHNKPVLINEQDAAQAGLLDYKILAWPIRVEQGPLLALLVLFRRRQALPFAPDDLVFLEQVTAQIPDAVLAELQRIHTTRTLASRNQPAVRATTMPQAAQPPPAAAQVPDAIALLLPEYVEDEPQEEVDEEVDTEPLPMVVGSPLPSVTERVRTALSNDAFELYAQRITPLHDYGRPERFEVLLRMPDKYGLQTPAAFMGAAEAGDLLPALDLWVIRHTLGMLRLNKRLGRVSKELSVNLSAASLANTSFIEQVLAEIRNSRIAPGQIGFEVSENVAIHHLQALRGFAQQLHEAGCRMTLDNCRIGTEIFDLMPQAAIGCMKIDGSIIREAGISPSSHALIEAIVRRATDCGIESVAEHVESQLVCNTVISAGVDYAQGYLLEVPAPLAKLFY